MITLSNNDAGAAIKQLKATLGKVKTAFRRSINKALTVAQRTAARGVAKTYRITAPEYKKTLVINKAKGDKLEGSVNSRSNALSALRFSRVKSNTVRPRGGPFVNVKRGAGGKIPPAFVVSKNGGSFLATRMPKGSRYKFKKLYSLAPARMMANDEIMKQIDMEAMKTLNQGLNAEADKELK